MNRRKHYDKQRLEAIQQSIGIDELSGVVEMDETFFAESFKGNHKKGNPNWTAPRKSGKSRKRGKQVEYRGISHEQVCVFVATELLPSIWVTICIGLIGVRKTVGLTAPKKASGYSENNSLLTVNTIF